jgi:hypothetical protein
MKKKRAKLTIKDVASTVLRMQQVQTEVIDWVKNISDKLDMIDNTLGAYLHMIGAGPELSKYIEKEIEKQKKEKKDNTKWVSPNDPGDESDAK